MILKLFLIALWIIPFNAAFADDAVLVSDTISNSENAEVPEEIYKGIGDLDPFPAGSASANTLMASPSPTKTNAEPIRLRRNAQHHPDEVKEGERHNPNEVEVGSKHNPDEVYQ